MEVTNHVKTKWVIRGDQSRHIIDAWEGGMPVECPDYHYDRARLDESSGSVILMTGGRLETVINTYEGVELEFVQPVKCYDCGHHHHSTGSCPECESEKWVCR